MSNEMTPADVVKVLDRAITLVDRFVPVEDRTPTSGGGGVRTTAVGVIAAARAVVQALVELEKPAAQQTP